ncbi:rCG43969 [Rattus norvegicus]|uniref:RCG43969 n=1 Tax=Rattus norvegicus TaxID=10116 RepID=A6J6Y9_RAT|nr:rCG43969 [Rattus norvegicus]
MNNVAMMHCLATFQKSDLLPEYVCLKDRFLVLQPYLRKGLF